MSVGIELKPVAEFTDRERADLSAMKAAVYPERPGGYPETDREWRRPQWGVFVRDRGQLVSYTGVVLVEGTANGAPAAIGGVGGVATHPDHRGRGYAALGLGRALDFLLGEGADFALLVCRPGLVDYYAGLGWRHFEARLDTTQYGVPEVFTFNEVMVGDLNDAAPRDGEIDLVGPAW